MLASLAVPILLSRISVPTEPTPLNQNFWQSANGPYGGYVIRLAVHPNGNIYGGLGGGGVFITEDDGNHWESANNELSDKHVRAFAIKKTNGEVYAGTAGGVFRETAPGRWEAVNDSLRNKDVRALTVNEINEDIFAGTADGVFRLRNNTAQWDTTPTPRLPKGNARDVRALLIKSNVDMYAGTADGVFRYTGISWHPVDSASINKDIRALVLDPSNQKLFAGTANGVFCLRANSASWDSINAGLTSAKTRDIRALVIKSSGDIFAATGAGVFYLKKNSTTWQKTTVLPDNDVYSLTCKNDQYLFAGTLCGVFRSSNNGSSWEEVNTGMPGFDITALAVNSQGNVFAGTRALTGGCNPFGAVVFRSSDGRGQWQKVKSGLPGVGITALAVKKLNESVFAGTSNGVYRLDNGSSIWAPDTIGLSQRNVRALAIRKTGEVFASTFTRGVFCKAHNSTRWDSCNTELPRGLARVVYALTVDKRNDDVFAGTAAGVFVLRNNLVTWEDLSHDLPDATEISTLAVNSLGHILAANSYRGVFLSTDNGASWDSVNVGLTNRNVNALAINSKDVGFAATAGGGVFILNGNTWSEYNSGLPNNLNVLSLAIDERNDVLYAGTAARGIFSIQTGSPDCPGAALFPAAENGAAGDPVIGVDGDSVYVEIRMKENPKAVDAFGFTVQVDTAHLGFVEAEAGDLTKEFIVVNAQENPPGSGRITAAGFGIAPIPVNSKGTLVRLLFDVTCAAAGSSNITISDLTDDVEGLTACPNLFTCQTCRRDGDVNNDGRLTPGDALCAYRIYLNGGVLPADCDNPNFDCELFAANPSCDDKVTPGDALAIYQRYLGGKPPEECFAIALSSLARSGSEYQLFLTQQTLIQPKSTNETGEVKVALAIDDGAGLDAFGLRLTFPGDQLQFIGIERTALTSEWIQLDAQASKAGELILGGFHVEPLPRNATGDLFQLTFTTKGQLAEPPVFAITEQTDDFTDATIQSAESGLDDIALIPREFELYQNFPNPFNPETSISYALPKPAHLVLKIYDVLGRHVRTLVNEHKAAGIHEVIWEGRDERGKLLPSGVYLYKVQAGEFEAVRKMLLAK